ncbi:MAG TPA: hypothetical protein ENK02_10740 [Planctomycetes bacterium]|nr:hypothetical protein [Planctomycetota bacterium]
MYVGRTLVLRPLALLLLVGGFSSSPQAVERKDQGGVERARVLLRTGDQAQVLEGIGLARRGFLVSLLPELKTLQAAGVRPPLKPALDQVIEELEHYLKMLPPGLDASGRGLERPSRGASSREVSSGEGARPPLHRVRLLCVDRGGNPLPGARLRAFSRDYDLFLPFEGFTRCDREGAAELLLPEGKWSFVAGAAPKGRPTLILLPEVPIVSTKTLLLFPEEERSWRMRASPRRGGSAMRLVLRHRDYPQLSLAYEVKGSGSKVEVPREGLESWLQVESADGSFVQAGGARLRFDPSRLRRLEIRFGTARLEAAELQLRLRGRDPSPLFRFAIQRSGQVLRLPGGSLDLGYRYRLAGSGRLEFGLRPYDLKKGARLWLGTPLRPWVWHLSYNKRYRGAPPFALQVFLRDPQDRLLERFVPERGRTRSGRIALRLYKGGQPWLLLRRLRNFRAELKQRVPPEAMDELEYEVLAPFPVVHGKQRGHHSTRFHTKNYDLTGPALLAPEIRNFLRAAEVLFAPIRAVALRPLPWLRGRIVFHATMPRGVRAYSSVRGNSNFGSGDLARCVRLADALRRTPIMHEHLHTVGYKHSDFMDVAGFRLRKKLYPIGSRGQGGLLGRRGRAYTDWFLARSKRPNKKAILRSLLARFGGLAFDAFFQRRRDRASLEASGLTEEEAKAVLFSRILGRELFAWFDVSPQRSKDLQSLIQPKASEAPPPALTGPGPRDLMARMQSFLRKAPPKGPGDPRFRSLLRDIHKLSTQRSRIRTALRIGAKAREAGRLSLAYPCFRAALQVAAKMGARIFNRTRSAAVEVCMGKPLHLGWL